MALSACAASTDVTPSKSDGSWDGPVTHLGLYATTDPGWNQELYWAAGDFNGDGLQDIAMTAWQNSPAYWGSGQRNPPMPVKVFVQQQGGRFEDATARLLGGDVLAYAQQPLVADLNRDGVNDIVLPGFTDAPALAARGIALVSANGAFGKKDLLPEIWVHGAALADVSGDGCIDVVTGDNRVGYFRGDCAGGFTATTYADNGPAWVVGGSACVADLNGDGHPDLLLLDAHTGEPNPVQDIVAYDMDWSAAPPIPMALHRLPVPVWDRNNTGVMRSHDQRCASGDLNHDGKPDVLVSSTLWATDGTSWQEQSKIQVYLNHGDWNFEDISDRAFPGRSDVTSSSMMLFLRDVNGDGIPDLYYPAESWVGRQANQVWLGNGDGTFRTAPAVDFDAQLAAARKAVSARGLSVMPSAISPVIPVPRADGRYDFVVPVMTMDAAGRISVDLELSRIGWVFQ